MKLRRAWLPPTLLLALGCSTPSTPPASTPSISPSAAVPSATPTAAATVAADLALTGKVYDDDQGLLAGVQVIAQAAGGPPVLATTESDGSYSLTLPAGTYDVTASKGGWTSRQQTVTLNSAQELNFGGLSGADFNPYFLSNVPEVDRVNIKEEAPGGPLTATIHLSEPLPADAQQDFSNRLEIASGISTAFLSANGSPDDLLKTTSNWDASGQQFTLQYAGPYLASGSSAVNYTVRLKQSELADKDPVTGDTRWEKMAISDADGHVIGFDRADYAFVKPQLFPLTYAQIANKDLGDTPPQRRWSLTHQSGYTFAAAKDVTGPGLESVRVNTNMQIGSATWDVLELHFTEPMWAVKDRNNLQYTELDKDKQLVLLSVSNDAGGANPQAFSSDFKIQTVRFSRLDPKVVYLHYAPEAFKDKKWVEVTLGVDLKDPSGNKADGAKSRLSGPVS